jgi:hypothetical protein
MNFTVINQTQDGVLLQMYNGDTQYLTNEEYETFLKNREKNGY